MAQISRAQAELLATDFLNSIGSKPEYSDIEMSETLISLIELAGTLILNATKNLEKGGHVSSGALIASLKVLDPEVVNNVIQLDIESLDYLQFLNKGVKGTKRGSGDFAFKSSFPSAKMVTAIAEWMKRGGLSTRNIKKSVSKLERKNKSISQLDHAYAVARSIKMNGIKRTGFLDKAVSATQSVARAKLGKALAVDIIKSLPTTLNDGISN